MKHTLRTLLTGIVLYGAAQTCFAGEIHQRRENQQDRIAQGVNNGSLTPRETARIEHQESRLNHEIRHDRQNGLSGSERRQISRQQNRLSHEIHAQKHDGQHR